jgi:hypothetical protein
MSQDLLTELPLRFLRTAFAPADWIAVLTKDAHDDRVVQRLAAVRDITARPFLAWVRRRAIGGCHVFVSVNAITPGVRRRTRSSICSIRHVFLDADSDGCQVAAKLQRHALVPPPSFVLSSSQARRQVIWRVSDFTCESVETLQRGLAFTLGTDPAATSCAQLMRLPGTWNYKYRPAPMVRVERHTRDHVYTPADFPVFAGKPVSTEPPTLPGRTRGHDATARARAYLAAVPPAISGQHGDRHTYQVCCRIVRGFALSDPEALAVLQEWNARCLPPWSQAALTAKIRGARRYGREPFGGRLGAHQ